MTLHSTIPWFRGQGNMEKMKKKNPAFELLRIGSTEYDDTDF